MASTKPLSENEQIQLEVAIGYQAELDSIVLLTREYLGDHPTWRFSRSESQQHQAVLDTIADAGFTTARCDIEEEPGRAVIQMRRARLSLEGTIRGLKARQTLFVQTCPRKKLVAALQATEGYAHKVFANFARLTADQYKEWRDRNALVHDQRVRSEAERWLSGAR